MAEARTSSCFSNGNPLIRKTFRGKPDSGAGRHYLDSWLACLKLHSLKVKEESNG